MAVLDWFAKQCNLGEANNPGPAVLGLANPTGLVGKESVVDDLSTGQCVYGFAETHLTATGVARFRAGLKSLKSSFTRFVSGHPVPPRAAYALSGEYSGVGVAATGPLRILPTQWDQDLWRSSRVVTVCCLFGNLWVQGAVVYGYASRGSSRVTVDQTCALLGQLEDRIIWGAKGPRFIMGDFNFEPGESPIFAAWEDQGWLDAQTLAFRRWGVDPQPTCKQKTVKDYIWLSPELQRFVVGLELDQAAFADHAVMKVHLELPSHSIEYVWRKPRPVPEVVPTWQCSEPSNWSALTPSDQYQAVWHSYEQWWSASCQQQGVTFPAACFGRAATRDVRKVVAKPPLRSARDGDLQPGYYGFSRSYARWFKQLRRLQAFAQSVQQPSSNAAARAARLELWAAIQRAPGFQPSFSEWWKARMVDRYGVPGTFPIGPPTGPIASSLYLAFKAEVRAFEARLNTQRIRMAKQRRKEQPCLVFRDIQQARPAAVDVLLEPQRAVVTAVNQEDCSLVLDKPVRVEVASPVFVGAQPRQVIHAEEEVVWLESVQEEDVGATLRQDKLCGDLPSIFQAFTAEWSARWDRHRDTPEHVWAPAEAIVDAVPMCPEAPLPPLTREQWRQAVQRKKAYAAVGPDGVSKADMQRLPPALEACLLTLAKGAESDGVWPEQMLVGAISALAKKPDSASVGEYRPITILALPYRVWSSIRARQLLAQLGLKASARPLCPGPLVRSSAESA